MQKSQATRPPTNQYEAGTFFYNGADRKLYLATDYKILNTPDLLWYKFNNTTQDFSSGQKNEGTTAGSPAYTTGKYNTAITMDGTDDKIVIPAAIGLDWDSDWTISFWINIPTGMNANEEIYILERYEDADEYCYILGRASGSPATRIDWYIIFADEGAPVTELIGQTLGSWQDTFVFVTFGHDTSLNDVYFGSIVGTTEKSSTNTSVAIPNISFTTEDFEIGRSQAEASFGDGPYTIDSFKIFNSFKDPRGTTTALISETAKIDSLNLDKINWSSYTGTVVAAT